MTNFKFTFTIHLEIFVSVTMTDNSLIYIWVTFRLYNREKEEDWQNFTLFKIENDDICLISKIQVWRIQLWIQELGIKLFNEESVKIMSTVPWIDYLSSCLLVRSSPLSLILLKLKFLRFFWTDIIDNATNFMQFSLRCF